MVVLLHISGIFADLLQPHILTLIAWKLQTAVLPRLQLEVENCCRDFHDFIILLRDLATTHKEVHRIKLALQKHGKVTAHLGQGRNFEVVKVETQFEPPFARKRLKNMILGRNDRFEWEDCLRCEVSVWEYLAQFPHRHFPTLRANHSNDSPPCFDYRPVGERDLEAWLQHHHDISCQDDIFKMTLLGWFGCVQSIMVHLGEVTHILHRDIKPKNFIICSDHIYLIDHSMSRILTEESGYTSAEWIDVDSAFCAPEGMYKVQKITCHMLIHSQVYYREDPIGFPADIFGFGLIFLYMLTALCGHDPSVLTNKFKDAENNFRHPEKRRWVVEEHLPALQTNPSKSFCTPSEFEAMKEVIVEMIQGDPVKRPSPSTIILPLPFQGRCCSPPYRHLHQQTASASYTERPGPQAQQVPQGLSLPVPVIVVDEDLEPCDQGQHARTLTPSSQTSEPSFGFSQNATEQSMSSTASILAKDDVWPARAKRDVAVPPKEQQSVLREDLAFSSGQWAPRTPEKGVNSADLEELSTSKRSRSAHERVFGARWAIFNAERPFVGGPIKRAREFSRQRRVQKLLQRSRQADLNRTRSKQIIPFTSVAPPFGADPVRFVETPLTFCALDYFQQLPVGSLEGTGTFLESTSRKDSELLKRKSVQEPVFHSPEAQSDFYDALGLGPNRQPTWPPEQPLRNISSP